MCTSLISNRKKTIVGWNLDILDMEYRISTSDKGVYIEINDRTEGWMPLFGANSRGDFVGMPTCWPYDERSDPHDESLNVIRLNMDLLLGNKTLAQIRDIADSKTISSLSGVTFMSALSDKEGNVLHLIPGQGFRYYPQPTYKVLTNFSPFKMDREKHPWMGWDRYLKAEEMLKNASEEFGVSDCFSVLKAVAQEVCPTVVSMVFDVTDNTVYWCEQRHWDSVRKKQFS